VWRRWLWVPVAVVVLLAAASCGDSDVGTAGDSAGDTTDDTVAGTAPASEGTGASPVPADSEVTMEWFGHSEDEATAKATDEGREWRIARTDGETFPLTDDFVPGRVTFDIDDGTITFARMELDQGIAVEGAQDPADVGFIGVSVDEAMTVADEEGRAARVIMVDGEARPATADFIEDRLNLYVVDGVVTGVTLG